jgi:hypothetical protein
MFVSLLSFFSLGIDMICAMASVMETAFLPTVYCYRMSRAMRREQQLFSGYPQRGVLECFLPAFGELTHDGTRPHRYIPAEAVYAVFECKPKIDKAYLEYAGAKAESVRRLKRTSVPIPHAGGFYPAKQHFEIVAGFLAIEADWKNSFSTAFENCHSQLTGLNV